MPIFGSEPYRRMSPAERVRARTHFQAWQLSQVPSIDAKFYAATHVIDEARHVEAYSRLLHEKFQLAYPITPTLARLLQGEGAQSRGAVAAADAAAPSAARPE